jgi:hypothetical protein
VWKKGAPALATSTTAPGTMALTSGYSSSSTEQYCINVSASTLTSEEAYSSYMLYLWPRLIHPLPHSSLTQQQCKHVQAPALAALTSKMHMNRHTSHHILFGDFQYGGLSLPDLYTDQGFGQLKLLMGHLKLEDNTGDLILIMISHLQLHVGSGTPFFALLYPHYARWIITNWLTSIWTHTPNTNNSGS